MEVLGQAVNAAGLYKNKDGKGLKYGDMQAGERLLLDVSYGLKYAGYIAALAISYIASAIIFPVGIYLMYRLCKDMEAGQRDTLKGDKVLKFLLDLEGTANKIDASYKNAKSKIGYKNRADRLQKGLKSAAAFVDKKLQGKVSNKDLSVLEEADNKIKSVARLYYKQEKEEWKIIKNSVLSFFKGLRDFFK